jgi:hypothetical protein
LRSLFSDESSLHTAGIFRSTQTLDRGHFPACNSRHGSAAGTRSPAVDQHGARAALAESATKLWAMQIKIVSQDVEYWLIRVPGIDADCPAIDTKFVDRHGFLSSIARNHTTSRSPSSKK